MLPALPADYRRSLYQETKKKLYYNILLLVTNLSHLIQNAALDIYKDPLNKLNI
jgi:hypothetical protein